MAWAKAEEHGYSLENEQDDLYYLKSGVELNECFSWTYYAFIDTRT